MKWILALLALCLGLSLSLNVYLWGQNTLLSPSLENTNPDYAPELLQKTNLAPAQSVTRAGKVSEGEYLDNPLDPEDEKSKQIFAVRQWIAAAEYDRARDYILGHLRAFPNDIDFLLLEAELIRKTNGINYTIAHYYELLDLPLNTEQRANVLEIIIELAADNINKLKTIRSWDILETFVEPLWQFDPTRKSFILALAESYAWQNQESLMENVLASLPKEDIDAKRIRQILTVSSDISIQQEESKPDKTYYDRVVRLQRHGDHFITNTFIGRDRLKLMIDTGASTTVINQRTFKSLSYSSSHDYVGHFTVNTAGGQVNAPVYRLNSMHIGGFKVSDIAVVVLPMPDFQAADGLLGMNFLREFDFKIDQENNSLLMKRL